MIKFFYSQHDLKANFFNTPMVSDYDPENFGSQIVRSIKLCRDPKQLEMIADCKLVFLGSFDDESGEFNLEKEPRVLVECDKLIESLKANA